MNFKIYAIVTIKSFRDTCFQTVTFCYKKSIK